MINYLLKYIFAFLASIFSILTFSQESYKLNLEGFNAKKNQFKDSISIIKYLESIKKDEIENGYFEFSIDTIIWNKNDVIATVYKGNKYKGIHLGNKDSLGSIDNLYIADDYLSINQIKKLQEEIVTLYENEGYPFTETRLDNILIQNNEISANLFIDKGKLYTVDSIHFKGIDMKPSFLQRVLNVKKGEYYNQKKIENLSNSISNVPFLSTTQNSIVDFYDNRSELYVFLQSKKANKVFGILGVQSNEETSEVSIVGEIQLNLINAFNAGEQIDIDWQSFQESSQNIELGFMYPYIFNTSLALDMGFKLLRQDSSFIQNTLNLGIDFKPQYQDAIGFFYNQNTSNAIGDNVNNSNFANITSRNFGVKYLKNNLDYTFNPRNGYYINSTFAYGNRTIRIPLGSTIPTEDVDLRSDIFDASIYIEKYFGFGKKNTIKTAMRTATKVNPQLYENELYRIGGMNILRGFDELSIFASSYWIGTLEYRYLFERNAHFKAFFDYAYVEQNTQNTFTTDTPFGFGAGISFATSAGIFSLSYALGSQQGNPVLFRASKIHFGFTSLF